MTAKKLGTFFLASAFVLLILSVFAGLFIFVVYPGLGNPESPDWPAWARVPNFVLVVASLGAPVLALAGATVWQVHAARQEISGALNWFAAAAVTAAGLHILLLTLLWTVPD
jgi:hypothetical protein